MILIAWLRPGLPLRRGYARGNQIFNGLRNTSQQAQVEIRCVGRPATRELEGRPQLSSGSSLCAGLERRKMHESEVQEAKSSLKVENAAIQFSATQKSRMRRNKS